MSRKLPLRRSGTLGLLGVLAIALSGCDTISNSFGMVYDSVVGHIRQILPKEDATNDDQSEKPAEDKGAAQLPNLY